MVIRVIVIVRVRDRVTFSVTRGKLVSIACEVNVHLIGCTRMCVNYVHQ